MNRTGFLKVLFSLAVLIPVSLFSQPDAKRFSFSPQMAISNIPCELHIQALREDGKADTAFSGSVRVEGLFQRGIRGNVAISQTGPFVLGKLLLKDIVF